VVLSHICTVICILMVSLLQDPLMMVIGMTETLWLIIIIFIVVHLLVYQTILPHNLYLLIRSNL